MLESEKLAIAAHLHVVMRRKIGRVTDVEWMVRSPEYAREVIRIGLAEVAHPELVEWAQRFLAAMFPPDLSLRSVAERVSQAERSGAASGFADSRLGRSTRTAPAPAPRYVGSLR